LLRDRFGEVSFWPAAGGDRARALLEGLVAGLSSVLIVSGVTRLVNYLVDKIPSQVSGAAPSVTAYPQSFSPGLALILSALALTLWLTLSGGVALGTLLRVCGNPVFVWLAILVAIGTLSFTASVGAMLFVKHCL